MTEKELNDKFLSKDRAQQIEAIYDPMSNKVYYQTKPYMKDGKVVVKRLCVVDVEVEQVYNIFEEYTATIELDNE